ncbi:MAG: M55 family metallopeptidase [Desulfobacula sp.]|jgi:D-amino peptidase
MKFMIAVDCEGTACVVGNHGKALSDSRDFRFAGEQATREANAAARALFEAGAKEVLVWDSHGQGINLLFDKLDSRCRVALGRGFDHRFPGLDNNFTGVLMIGYHAMEGTPDAVLAHTYSSESYQQIRVNGDAMGEIGLDAAVAGSLGVPLIFIASDQQGCREAGKIMPWIEYTETKKGYGRNCAVSKHPDTVQDEIYKGVLRAVKAISKMKPFVVETPIRIEITFKTIRQAVKALAYRRRGWKLKGLKTIEKKLDSMLDWNC